MKILAVLLALSFIACNASTKQNQEVFQPNGKAIRGFDAVAFHTDKKPLMGNGFSQPRRTWIVLSVRRRSMLRSMEVTVLSELLRAIKHLLKPIPGLSLTASFISTITRR
jgi:hypothetical protein